MYKYLEEINCEFCNAKEAIPLLTAKDYYHKTKGTYKVVQCKKCGFVYTNPRPKPNKLSFFYPDNAGYYNATIPYMDGFLQKLKKQVLIQFYNYPGKKSTIKRLFLLPLYIWLHRKLKIQGYPLFKEKGKVLDIGCSYGNFLYQLKTLGWTTKGIEMNQKAATFGRKQLGLDIETKRLEDFQPNTKYDVIMLRMVLEHLPNPKQIIKHCRQLLNDGGNIIITIPDFSGFESKIYKNHAYTLQVPTHFSHFTPRTITQLLDLNGFKEVKIIHHQFDRDLVAPLEYMKEDNKDKKWLRIILTNKIVRKSFVRCFIWLLSLLGKTSRMTITAKN